MITFCTFFQLFLALFFFQKRGNWFVEGAMQDDAIRVHQIIKGDDPAADEANDVASQTQILTGKTSTATGMGTVDAVYDLVDRILKDPRAKDSICLRIVDSGGGDSVLSSVMKGNKNHPDDKRLWFRLEQQEKKSQPCGDSLDSFGCRQQLKDYDGFDIQKESNTNNVIIITATSASELTAGLGYYFKHYCNFTLEWSTGGRAGGSHIVLPKIWPVPLEHDNTTITRYRTTKWRYVK